MVAGGLLAHGASLADKPAKALGLTILPSLLLRADDVLQ